MEYVNPQEALINAIRKRDVTEVNRCLFCGANATTVYNDTNGILQAVIENAPEILEVLLISCVHIGLTPQQMPFATTDYLSQMFQTSIQFSGVHSPSISGNSPIHLAALYGHYECADILLKYYSPVDVINGDGLTPLYLAVYHPKIIALLLQYNANPNVQFKWASSGYTVLHRAAHKGILDTVLHLCKAGVNLNELNLEACTPIYYAIKGNQYEIVKLLLSYGATLNRPTFEEFRIVWRQYLSQDTDRIKQCNSCTRKSDMIAYKFSSPNLLHECISFISLDMTRLLISHLDVRQINKRGRDGRTPLMYAMKLCDYDSIEYLLLNGARDVKKFSGTQKFFNSFHLAIIYCKDRILFRKIIRILLLHGFRIHNNILLYKCISMNKYDKAAILLKEGALRQHSKHFDFFDFMRCKNEIQKRNGRNFLTLLANMGITVTEETPQDRDERYLAGNTQKMVSNDCLSLQALCRISIRRQLIRKMNSMHINVLSSKFDLIKNSFGCSVLRYLISRTGISKNLQNYIYNFNDLPSIGIFRHCRHSDDIYCR